MGIWGSSLYANDCSCDVRDTYKQFLQYFSNEDAYKKQLKNIAVILALMKNLFCGMHLLILNGDLVVYCRKLKIMH